MWTVDVAADDALRQRLTSRFGREVEPWLDGLPLVLSSLAERWHVEFDCLVQRGTMSVVVRCRALDGVRAVLKVSPDRSRLANEAAALRSWRTPHSPSVLAVDRAVGALLIEAIDPGTALIESSIYPDLEDVAGLLTSLHASGVPDRSFPPVERRVAYLFDSSARHSALHPELPKVVSSDVYERGRRLALRLARDLPSSVLLHGDLTPSNILDGGDLRGLVAVDPAPCVGDAAFDAIDLVLWQADNLAVIEGRATHLAAATRTSAERLLDWCTAFAGMTALELAGSSSSSPEHIAVAVSLADRSPT